MDFRIKSVKIGLYDRHLGVCLNLDYGTIFFQSISIHAR